MAFESSRNACSDLRIKAGDTERRHRFLTVTRPEVRDTWPVMDPEVVEEAVEVTEAAEPGGAGPRGAGGSAPAGPTSG